MAKKVLILDSCVLCVWLKVPGKETFGSKGDRVDYDMVKAKIEHEMDAGTTFVLPLASIIETGNHITHADNNYTQIQQFADLMVASADEKTPWAAFTQQGTLWNTDGLKALAERWRKTAPAKQSLGDASIVDVAYFYCQMGYEVEIFTGDKMLKSHQPPKPVEIGIPRRRK